MYAGSEDTAKPYDKLDHGFDMATFIAEKVDFEDEPSGHNGYTQSSECQFDAHEKKATKTVKRVYKMKEGQDVVREVKVSKLVG